MVKEALIKELNALFSSYLESNNLEFVDLIYRTEGSRLILTVLADKPQGNGLASASQSHKPQGGITLQECAGLCRKLKNLLEEKNIIEVDYVLEVSSPGLDRPLKSKRDFMRSLDKETVFFLNDLVGGRCQWQGVICKLDESVVFIRAGEQTLEIPLVKINKAQLVI